MRSTAIAVLAAAMLTFALAAPASADYYLSANAAEHLAERALKAHYHEDSFGAVKCRPQRSRAQRSHPVRIPYTDGYEYRYHRSLCHWVSLLGTVGPGPGELNLDLYDGWVLIIGTSGPGSFAMTVLRGAQPTDNIIA